MSLNHGPCIAVSFLAVLLFIPGCWRRSRLPAELQAVHSHYEGTPLHQAAADFLLDNIRYHCSAVADVYERYCNEVDSIYSSFTDDSLMNKVLEDVAVKYQGRIRTAPDMEQLTAEYLIRNIDSCMAQRERIPWLRDLAFEEFCEYYLPYKFAEGQALDAWRSMADLSGEEDVRILNNPANLLDNPKVRYKAIHTLLRSRNHMDGPDNPLQYQTLRPDVLSHAHGTNCFARAYAVLAFCRANGLAAAVDFTPSWTGRGGVHAWISLITPGSQDQPFEPWTENIEPGYFLGNGWVHSKVYRMGWKPRKILMEAARSGIRLPGELRHLFVRDVTDQYNKTARIRVRCGEMSGFVFLSVFDGNRWTPVDIAKSRMHKAAFDKVTTGMTYCLVSTQDGEQCSIPFRVGESGEVQYVKASGEHESITVSRKFMTTDPVFKVREHLGGLAIYGSSDGREFMLLGSQEPDRILSEQVFFRNEPEVRYLKFIPQNGHSTDIAELFVYGEDGNAVDILASGLAWDRDPLTSQHFRADDEIVVDMKKNVQLGHISVIRRGDGNDIMPGDVYELFFNDGKSWILIDRKTANDVQLTFENVPQDALLWIRDVSNGQDNACFQYENGRQLWR